MPGRCLRWPENRDAGVHRDELAVDANVPPQEVEPIHREAETLTLTQAGAGGQNDERPVTLGHVANEALDGLDRERNHLVVVPLG